VWKIIETEIHFLQIVSCKKILDKILNKVSFDTIDFDEAFVFESVGLFIAILT